MKSWKINYRAPKEKNKSIYLLMSELHYFFNKKYNKKAKKEALLPQILFQSKVDVIHLKAFSLLSKISKLIILGISFPENLLSKALLKIL